MKLVGLIYDKEKEYWYCSECGAIYRQPVNWKPKADYCMRCKTEWDFIGEEEKDD